jgi:hypothetical protein
MNQYGLVKTLEAPDGAKIKLVGNALTFVIYKSYFGRDLLNDIVGFAGRNANAELVRKFDNLKVTSVESLANLNESEQKELFNSVADFTFDTEFILNFISALIATARYPEKPDVVDIIVSVPPHWVADREIINELLEFLSLFITQKKR